MPSISHADPNTLIILAAAIALSISDSSDPDELSTVGNFLTAVADLILLKAGQLSNQQDKKSVKEQIEDIEYQLYKLKRKYY
jgi:hypothetical protein